jgi:hypothetical protein
VIKFMVLSAPRSASTWTANWLTTAKTLCLHDPVLKHRPEDLDAIPCDRMLGLACTALALQPAFVNAHPAKKVIVHRDLKEVNRSLISIGFTRLGPIWTDALEKIEGLHVEYADLFTATYAPRIYKHLTGLSFDAARHEELMSMHIEPHFDKIILRPDRAREFRKRVQEALA